MFWSRFFCITEKQSPKGATIPSHKLMLQAGLIGQSFSGVYNWLPMGFRVLDKITNIIREEQNNIGAQQVAPSILQDAEPWKKSGRYNEYGTELLKITDRNYRELVYSPTNEEQMAQMIGNYTISYNDLPIILYQIQPKFRDEIRPRFGVMRAKEFLMKDGYSFDIDESAAMISYEKIFMSYIKIFRRMKLNVVPVLADPGLIGGDITHEFHILSPFGESVIYYDNKITSCEDYKEFRSLKAYSDERTDCIGSSNDLNKSNSIEVGHVFLFGEKYTKPLNITFRDRDNTKKHPYMGSYGIGVSRLVAAIVEANHDERGIIWPVSVAPFQVYISNLSSDDEESCKKTLAIYNQLLAKGIDVILDDRDLGIGEKLKDAELIGFPFTVIIHKNKPGFVELKRRNNLNNIEIISSEQVVDIILMS